MSYYDLLPGTYFDPTYAAVIKSLLIGDNVLLVSPYGFGGKTFFNFFLSRQKTIDRTIISWSNNLPVKTLLKQVKENHRRGTKQIVIMRQVEKIDDLPVLLEKLNDIRQPNPQNTSYLIITDHRGLTDIDQYLAGFNTFFSSRYLLGAFDFEKTTENIRANCLFFGWPYLPQNDKKVFQLSGGIPRLIKHIYKEINESQLTFEDPSAFLFDQSISFQLQYLTDLIMKIDPNYLIKFGILDAKKKIKSELLAMFFSDLQVKIAKQNFAELTRAEAQLFSLFFSNPDEIISIDRVADFLSISDDDFSLWAVYKLIARLKEKIKSKYDLVNLKGRGYKLGFESR